MRRRELIEAFRKQAAEQGYTLHITTQAAAPAAINKFPVMLMAPPKLSHKSGRYHGRLTYEVKINLLHEALRLSPDERESLRDNAETTLFEMFIAMSNHRHIAMVDELQIVTDEESKTPFGEISTVATATVATIY